MQYLVLLAVASVALANSQNSGYEAAEVVQPPPAVPPSSSGGDQQAYNSDGSQGQTAPVHPPPSSPLLPSPSSMSQPSNPLPVPPSYPVFHSYSSSLIHLLHDLLLFTSTPLPYKPILQHRLATRLQHHPQLSGTSPPSIRFVK
ncbi:hypothetical protein COOONC_19538 [Cooperia oncophora]